MRIAMRIVAGLTVLCIVLGLAFLPLIGIPVVEILAAGQVDPATANLLTGTVFGALFLGGLALVALVVVIYRFRLRLLAV